MAANISKLLITILTLHAFRKMVCYVFILGSSSLGYSQLLFYDTAQESGVDYVFNSPSTDGCGITFMDINADGRDDLSFGSGTGEAPRFYFAYGDSLLLVEEVFNGLEFEAGGSRALNWVDYDNDGDKDLSLMNIHSEIGYPNSGVASLYNRINDSVLVDVTLNAGWSLEPITSYCSAWADYDNDGWLDCYITQRIGTGPSPNFLYHNNGDGTFTEVAVALNVDDLSVSYQPLFFDYDLDGDVDLFIANDKIAVPNVFYENNGDGTFNDISQSSGLGVNMSGMGVALGDFDDNGYLDLYVADALHPDPEIESGNKLFLNSGTGIFTVVGEEIGTEGNNTVWGVNMFDVDNDMDLDVFFVTSGGTNENAQELYFNENGLLQLIEDSSFHTAIGPSFGTAIGDIDNDGFYDIAVANNIVGKHQLWHNRIQNDNHWIKFNLEGVVGNRDAIGALVEIWTDGWKQIRFTTCGNSYGSQDSDTYIVGLGPNPSVDSLIIHWPGGGMNAVYDIPSKRRLDILENVEDLSIDCLPDAAFASNASDDQTFLFNALNNVPDWQYSWDFGDDISSSGAEVSHSFLVPGSYEVCLTVTNQCTWITECSTIEVECPQAQASFEWSADDLSLQLSETSLNSDSLTWSLDGVFFIPQDGAIELSTPGIYELCLIAMNACDADTLCESIEVICPSPVASFDFQVEDLLLSLLDTSTEADSILWILDEEPISELSELDFDLPSEGIYEICLIAINGCTSDTSCANLTVECPLPIASFIPIPEGLTLIIDNLSTDYDSLLWSMGDGTLIVGALEEYSYNTEGEYLVCLTSFNPCGIDTLCTSVTIEDLPIGLEENLSTRPIIYPNPVSDVLMIESNEGFKGLNELSVFSVDGRLILRQSFDDLKTDGLVQWDLSKLEAGFYILRLSNESAEWVYTILKE